MLSRRALYSFLILSLALVLHAPRGLAQGEPSRFQPPPPPLGIPDEVGDEEIEEIEGDAPVRPPTFPGGMPGMPGGNVPGLPPTSSGGMPPGGGGRPNNFPGHPGSAVHPGMPGHPGGAQNNTPGKPGIPPAGGHGGPPPPPGKPGGVPVHH